MGIFISQSKLNCCCSRSGIIEKDFYIDNNKYNNKHCLNKIILIQKHIRGFLIRLNNISNLTNSKYIKEISMDYNTEDYETNHIIMRLNNLLPKFELTEKETYLINNSELKIMGLLYKNKSIYKGMVNKNYLKHGFGKLFMEDGSIYKGFFSNNLMEGRGRLLNINGFVYEGEFKKGFSNGYGKYLALDGTSYKGTWIEDKQNGHGDETYPDGSHYIGNFLYGKKQGFGKLIFREQNIYEGMFENNQINGEGIFRWKDGRIFIGTWKKNKMHGYGIFIWPDKKKYYGHYENNLKNGFGLFYWENGNQYEGFWKNGKQEGYGITCEDNENKFGFWLNGLLEYQFNDNSKKKDIIKTFEEVKNQKDFILFQQNIEKYEKQLSDGSSSKETNFNTASGLNKISSK